MVILLNDTIRVEPDTNKVNDQKLEPRQVKLLLFLIENNGRVVEREEITEKLWDGYGGANEAMTQAVSFLRKAIGGAGHQVIETVPKKGYRLNASVREECAETMDARPANRRVFQFKPVIAGIALLVLFALISYLFIQAPKTKLAPAAPVSDKSGGAVWAPTAPKPK